MMWNEDRYFERTYFTMADCKIDDDVIIGIINEGPTPMARKFTELFFTEYGDNWCIYCDGTDTPDPKKVSQWKSKFTFTFKTTYDRYKKVIELYDQQKDNLLNRLESQSVSKFNDTPQDRTSEATDGFNSTITTNTASVDPGEMMTRLRNIERNYTDIYAQWINEFAYLFGEAI